MDDQHQEKPNSGGWGCSLCTYNNIGGQLNCDLCGTPRNGKIEGDNEVVRRQAELLNPQWFCRVCTFENIQSAQTCAKCETERPNDGIITCPSPTEAPTPQVRKTSRAASPFTSSSKTAIALVKKNSINEEEASSSSNKWKCSRCTYLNYPSASRCTMCSLPHTPVIITAPAPRVTKDCYKPIVTVPNIEIRPSNRMFLVTGNLSRYMNFFTGQSQREDLFFRSVGAIITKDVNALNMVVTYLVNDGNVMRSLNHIEATLAYEFCVRVHVECGDTLLSLAKRTGLTEVQRILERVNNVDDELPCAAASSSSDLYNRIYHILHFCRRSSYNVGFRPCDFNIFHLPFPKAEFCTRVVSEVLQRNFASCMRQPAVRYVQIAPSVGDDPRLSNVMSCPPTLMMRNRGGNQSLFDAVMQSLFGVCDRQNVLRTELHEHLNSHIEWYKPLALQFYQIIAEQSGSSMTEDELEDFWLQCSSLEESHPIEPIHLFALSHVLRRPLLVLPISTPVDLSKWPRNLLSLATSRSNPYHFLEGFYIPFFQKNEIVTRSPICIIHENGQFFSWIANDEHCGNAQNFVIVNYPRGQLAKMFRFVEEDDEKNLRSFLGMLQLSANSVAIRRTPFECIPEVTTFYYEYLTAVERTVREQQSTRVADVMKEMASAEVLLNNSPVVAQMFNQSAKRLLSRHSENSSNSENSDSGSGDDDGTATKIAKVNCSRGSPF